MTYQTTEAVYEDDEFLIVRKQRRGYEGFYELRRKHRLMFIKWTTLVYWAMSQRPLTRYVKRANEFDSENGAAV